LHNQMTSYCNKLSFLFSGGFPPVFHRLLPVPALSVSLYRNQKLTP